MLDMKPKRTSLLHGCCFCEKNRVFFHSKKQHDFDYHFTTLFPCFKNQWYVIFRWFKFFVRMKVAEQWPAEFNEFVENIGDAAVDKM